jgi:peptide-methionine (R)-S-oxide reductase
MLQVDRDAGTNSWLAPRSLECWELRMVNRRNLLLGSLFAFAAGTAMRLLKGTPKAVAADSNSFEIVRNEEEWRRLLTPAQFHVLREHGTERAGSSPLDHEFRPGTYLCVGCDLELYKSDTKFNSGTGWPSFWAPIEGVVGTSEDRTLFTSRTEVHCRRCGGHLGHVFEDGPPPTGLRYCMNGIALRFVPA